jgi:hypothetical protein
MTIIANTLHANLQLLSPKFEDTFQTHVKFKMLERKKCVECNPQSPQILWFFEIISTKEGLYSVVC